LLRLGAPSTHVWVKSEGAGRAPRAQNSNSLYHFWQRYILSHKHRSTKGCVNNEIGIHRKHMRNNETCMRLYRTIQCDIN
ncbi:hypothetical protein BHM03_00024210, partial [Ensete ventricosum]